MSSFVSELSDKDRDDVTLLLEAFVTEHATHHRPIALVSSGGTACDLELNSVRCLDNFSTGLRGAISVEEFIKRGYAVIHLWREGSASPYARVVSQYLGLRQANHALTVTSLGMLLAVEGNAIDEEEDLIKAVLEEQSDPFLSSDEPFGGASVPQDGHQNSKLNHRDEVVLQRGVAHSTRIHRALRERAIAITENRLITIPFRTVEEYLAKLEISATALRDCQSLTTFFLAAAVSDFYIPKSERSEHKIQSSGGQEGLTLNLKPVPKTLGLLRSKWAPDAFVVSFKLETDMEILRQKAERAVDRYGCHLVVGNILSSRHQKVWILSPEDQRSKIPSGANRWSFSEINKMQSVEDSLDSAIIDFVVQSHFEYISWHFHTDGSGVKAAERAQKILAERKRQVHSELFWKRIQKTGLDVFGAILAVGISYSINAVLRQRLRGS